MITPTGARTLALWFAILSIAACASPTTAPQPITASPNSLFVDAANQLGAISPYVYGSNYGPWVFVPLEMRPQAIAAKISFLRFPGGNWGDLNDLDEWQIDQFMAFAKQINAEPSISARLLKGSPEKAAALVRYVNQTKKYGVRYWSIGNEPSLYGKDYDTVRFNKEWREFANAMRGVDSSIKLMGPDTHQFTAQVEKNPKDVNGRDWLVEFLKANGDAVDVVAVHRYPFPVDERTPPTRDQLLANSREWDDIVPLLRKTVRENSKKELPIAVTEVNSNWASMSGGEATPETLYNALWWADSLGRMIRNRVNIVAQFALQSNPGAGEFGLIARTEVRLPYYVYMMYQRFGNTLVYSYSDDPSVSIVAAKRDDGALTLMIINLKGETIRKPLIMNGYTATSAETWLFDETHLAVQTQATSLSGLIQFPPYSMTLLILRQ
jgi:hypothetical protein